MILTVEVLEKEELIGMSGLPQVGDILYDKIIEDPDDRDWFQRMEGKGPYETETSRNHSNPKPS